LEGRKTQKDIEAWKIIAEINVNRNRSFIKEEARKIMKSTKRKGRKIEKQLSDSIRQERINEKIHIYNLYPPFNKFDIYELGNLSDKRFIAGLETILTKDYTLSLKDKGRIDNDNWNYTISNMKKACTYALAKLGVQKYKEEIFENDKDINYMYLGTVESYLRYIEINFKWNEPDYLDFRRMNLPKAYTVIRFANGYVTNIPKELQLTYREIGKYVASFDIEENIKKIKNYDPLKDEENKEVIQKIFNLYQWIMDNKDTLELNK
jgi:hypothetical protein